MPLFSSEEQHRVRNAPQQRQLAARMSKLRPQSLHSPPKKALLMPRNAAMTADGAAEYVKSKIDGTTSCHLACCAAAMTARTLAEGIRYQEFVDLSLER